MRIEQMQLDDENAHPYNWRRIYARENVPIEEAEIFLGVSLRALPRNQMPISESTTIYPVLLFSPSNTTQLIEFCLGHTHSLINKMKPDFIAFSRRFNAVLITLRLMLHNHVEAHLDR